MTKPTPVTVSLTFHQAAVLTVSIGREIRREQALLERTENPAIRQMVEASIEEKRQMLQAVNQGMDNLLPAVTEATA